MVVVKVHLIASILVLISVMALARSSEPLFIAPLYDSAVPIAPHPFRGALLRERNPECRSAQLRANFLAALTGCVSARRRRDGILARGERAIASHPGFYRSTQNRTPKGVRGARST